MCPNLEELATKKILNKYYKQDNNGVPSVHVLQQKKLFIELVYTCIGGNECLVLLGHCHIHCWHSAVCIVSVAVSNKFLDNRSMSLFKAVWNYLIDAIFMQWETLQLNQLLKFYVFIHSSISGLLARLTFVYSWCRMIIKFSAPHCTVACMV